MLGSEVLAVAKEICEQIGNPGAECSFWYLIHRLKYVIETDELQQEESLRPALAADVLDQIMSPKLSSALCPREGCNYNGFDALNRHLCTHPECLIKGTPGNRAKMALRESIPEDGGQGGTPLKR
jgi:hypothetical protein